MTKQVNKKIERLRDKYIKEIEDSVFIRSKWTIFEKVMFKLWGLKEYPMTEKEYMKRVITKDAQIAIDAVNKLKEI